MKTFMAAASIAALGATGVLAGGIERANNNYGLLFTPGDQIELTFSHVEPEVSGTYSPTLTFLGGTSDTGNMANAYTNMGFGYKNDVTEKLTFGLYVNQPYGADAAYVGGFYNGLTAQWDSSQVATVVKYQLADRVSVYGGVRFVRSSADITIPDQMIRASTTQGRDDAQAAVTALTGAGVPATDPRMIQASTTLATLNAVLASPAGALEYNASGEQDTQMGYVLGAAYEIPDIALRVGLTWESAITHEFDTAETLPGFALNSTGTTEVEMPQSLALDFQSGVAAGTLVFGQIKWTEWSKWEVRPPGYEAITGGNVTGFDNDTITYRLGVGRQFSEAFSAFAQVTYEEEKGGIASRLAPTDGRISLGLGGQYTKDNMKVRAGLEYAKLGDAVDSSGTQFSGNTATGFGVSVTFGF